jgi:hypothetical protein
LDGDVLWTPERLRRALADLDESEFSNVINWCSKICLWIFN